MGRFSLEIAEESPHLRKRVSATFDHWQHAIAAVVQQAVAEKELPAKTDPESLAGFLLNSWEGALLRSQAEKSDAPLEILSALRVGWAPQQTAETENSATNGRSADHENENT